MTDFAATFRKPFAQQVAAFRLRLGDLVPTARWDDLVKSEHDTGFMVAGALKADLLADLGAAVDRAIVDGTGLEAFRRDFREIVDRRGWHGWTGEGTKGGEAWRTKVIYRTNMATSYSAGRFAQLIDGKFEYWVYRHGGSREPRLQHLGWDGLILPADHPFWATHFPPNGWGCSCYVVGARSLAGAVRVGGKPSLKLPDNWQAPDPKTGVPVGIHKGWDYAPGASVARTITTLAPKLASLPSPTGAALVADWPAKMFDIWSEVFDGFVDETLAGPPRGRLTIVGALLPRWVEAARANGIIPETAEIAVRDRDVWHTFRSVKKAALDMDWYRALPQHLRTPDAVMLDNTHAEGPAFLLIFNLGVTGSKLVVRVNYFVKKHGVMNVVETGRMIRVNDLRETIGRGAILIEGDL